MESLAILHRIVLSGGVWGGVEKQFTHLLKATAQDPRVTHLLSENLRGAVPAVRAALAYLAVPAHDPRIWKGIPIPKIGPLRESNRLSFARAVRPNVVLNWSRFGEMEPALLARRVGAAAVYWERGAAWFARQAPDRRFGEAYALYLTNSEASRAMLDLRWGIRDRLAVCKPGILLSPEHAPSPRKAPLGRTARLGFAARLQSFKGGALALHALRLLLARGHAAELSLVGSGPDGARLRQIAHDLQLNASVRFLGSVSDMKSFYEGIDILLHPALREPYGNVCAEAQLYGVPVITTSVDGLPEVVDDGVTGYCIQPSLPLARYARFGANLEEVPPLVYRPGLRDIGEPGVPDPEQLAMAIAGLLAEPERYEAFSAAALRIAPDKFSYGAHVERLIALLQSAAAGRRA